VVCAVGRVGTRVGREADLEPDASPNQSCQAAFSKGGCPDAPRHALYIRYAGSRGEKLWPIGSKGVNSPNKILY
jgi:hypothetical protein